MSLCRYGIGLSGILGATLLLAELTAADDKEPAKAAAARAKAPRVVVRDLRHEGGRSDRRAEATYRWGRGYLPGGGLYAPYGGYSYGWHYSPRWRAEAYRALRYAQRKERERRFNRQDMAQRKECLLDQHEQALAAGLRRLKEGQTARATVALTLAAKLNQGDPACRIHLAQARLAQGHYLEAALVLRRALQLQPKLVYADLHLQDYYSTEDALANYTEKLAAWLEGNQARVEVYFLLGFLEFQRGDFDAAHAAFEQVGETMPDDDLTRAYLEITKPPATRGS